MYLDGLWVLEIILLKKTFFLNCNCNKNVLKNNHKKHHCVLSHRTRSAFDAKMQKASKSTDFRVPLSVCTMFNVLMDAKKQCSKLCVLDTGQEVSERSPDWSHCLTSVMWHCRFYILGFYQFYLCSNWTLSWRFYPKSKRITAVSSRTRSSPAGYYIILNSDLTDILNFYLILKSENSGNKQTNLPVWYVFLNIF